MPWIRREGETLTLDYQNSDSADGSGTDLVLAMDNLTHLDNGHAGTSTAVFGRGSESVGLGAMAMRETEMGLRSPADSDGQRPLDFQVDFWRAEEVLLSLACLIPTPAAVFLWSEITATDTHRMHDCLAMVASN